MRYKTVKNACATMNSKATSETPLPHFSNKTERNIITKPA